jgi:hypothetical protein
VGLYAEVLLEPFEPVAQVFLWPEGVFAVDGGLQFVVGAGDLELGLSRSRQGPLEHLPRRLAVSSALGLEGGTQRQGDAVHALLHGVVQSS